MSDESPSLGVDLPDRFRSVLTADAERFAALYNGLQGMERTAFADAFGDSLETLRQVADVDAPELVVVLGLTVEAGTIVDASLLSVSSRQDGSVLHATEITEPPDAAVYLPVRAGDFPPGSGGSVGDVAIEEYREVVASMLYLRYELSEDDPDRYDDLYRRPLAQGLAVCIS